MMQIYQQYSKTKAKFQAQMSSDFTGVRTRGGVATFPTLPTSYTMSFCGGKHKACNCPQGAEGKRTVN